MKFFFPNGHFSTHTGSVECKGLITAKNSTLKTKTGLVEVKVMTQNDQNWRKCLKIQKNWLLWQINPIFFTGLHSCKLWKWSRSRNGQWIQKGAVKNQKMVKKDLKMNCFTHNQKLMKNNEIFFSLWPFLHSYRLSGVQGTDNCQKFNPGNKNRPCRGRNNDLKWPKLTKILRN